MKRNTFPALTSIQFHKYCNRILTRIINLDKAQAFIQRMHACIQLFSAGILIIRFCTTKGRREWLSYGAIFDHFWVPKPYVQLHRFEGQLYTPFWDGFITLFGVQFGCIRLPLCLKILVYTYIVLEASCTYHFGESLSSFLVSKWVHLRTKEASEIHSTPDGK